MTTFNFIDNKYITKIPRFDNKTLCICKLNENNGSTTASLIFEEFNNNSIKFNAYQEFHDLVFCQEYIEFILIRNNVYHNWVAILEETQEIIGFVGWKMINFPEIGFGPIVVKNNYQSFGIGRILFEFFFNCIFYNQSNQLNQLNQSLTNCINYCYSNNIMIGLVQDAFNLQTLHFYSSLEFNVFNYSTIFTGFIKENAKPINQNQNEQNNNNQLKQLICRKMCFEDIEQCEQLSLNISGFSRKNQLNQLLNSDVTIWVCEQINDRNITIVGYSLGIFDVEQHAIAKDLNIVTTLILFIWNNKLNKHRIKKNRQLDVNDLSVEFYVPAQNYPSLLQWALEIGLKPRLVHTTMILAKPDQFNKTLKMIKTQETIYLNDCYY
eukprot:TRINITY_DN717_c0_g1_i4.p1 TRINITY_DN717_c0_g1~~TRINITY_DN717_c0_g1_i4.p1  ORF type:complete len:380 (-),score=153.00 TRINITY_DN717_c0_g1_i4:172-1311(-)